MDSFDYSSALIVPFRILSVLGFWQKDSNLAYKIYGFVVHFTQVELILFGQMMFAIHADNLFELIDLLSLMFNYIGFCIKSWIFIYNLDRIVDLVEEFKALVSLSESVKGKAPTLVKPRVLQVRKLFLVFWYFCLLTTSLAGIAEVTAYIADPNPPYKVPYKIWAPFDFEYDIRWYIFMGTLQVLNPLIMCGVIAAVEFIPIYFLNGAAGLLDELSEIFLKLSSKTFGTKCEDELAQLEKCIVLHLRIKDFIKTTEEIFSTTIFVQGSISLLILCTTAFRLSKVDR